MTARRPVTDAFSDAIRAELAEFEGNTSGRPVTPIETVDLIKRLSSLVGYTGVHGALDKAIEKGGTALLNKLQGMMKGKVPQ